MKQRGLIFADCEASGLQFLSYPIEIGWAWAERTHVEARSLLIRPTTEWLGWNTGWNDDAERLHGISLEKLLSEGLDPADACRKLNHDWQGEEVAFDTGPAAHDFRWVSILYKAAAADPGFTLAQLSSDLCILAYARMLRVPEAIVLRLDRLAPKQTHRAAQDAAHWAWWRVALRLIGEEQGISTDDAAAIASSVKVRFEEG